MQAIYIFTMYTNFQMSYQLYFFDMTHSYIICYLIIFKAIFFKKNKNITLTIFQYIWILILNFQHILSIYEILL